MANLNEFIDYLNGQVNKGLYVLGAQTQVIKTGIVFSDDTLRKSLGTLKVWMNSIGQSSSNYTIVNNLYQSRLKKWGDIAFRIMDCSGLGMNWLFNIKHIASGDMTANGMMGKCQKLNKADLKRGDWVFKCYTSGSKKGKAYHIGYVVDNDLNVVEDYGKAKGVIKRSLSAGKWNAYGRPSYFADEIDKEVKPSKGGAYMFEVETVKEGKTGKSVLLCQKLLLADGYKGKNGKDLELDGDCGSNTVFAINSFQTAMRKKGIECGTNGKNDGSCGSKCWKALLGL